MEAVDLTGSGPERGIGAGGGLPSLRATCARRMRHDESINRNAEASRSLHQRCKASSRHC